MGNAVEVCPACYDVLRIALSLKSRISSTEKTQQKMDQAPPVKRKTCHKCRGAVEKEVNYHNTL